MDTVNRTSSLINKSIVRRKLLEHATDTRPHLGKTRVSGETMNEAEAVMGAWIRRKVADAQMRGVTI